LFTITTQETKQPMKCDKLVIAVCAFATIAPFALAQKAAAPVDLGTLGGSSSLANGINTGDIVVGGANIFSDAYQHAFYTNSLGYLEDLGSLIGVYGNSVANSIGPRGAIVGTSDQVIDSSGDVASHAFYFLSSRTGMQDVGTNGGTLSFGTAAGGGGAFGYSTIADDIAYCAFSWTKTNGMVNLNTRWPEIHAPTATTATLMARTLKAFWWEVPMPPMVRHTP
jgi:uncharacterized membrane protein